MVDPTPRTTAGGRRGAIPAMSAGPRSHPSLARPDAARGRRTLGLIRPVALLVAGSATVVAAGCATVPPATPDAIAGPLGAPPAARPASAAPAPLPPSGASSDPLASRVAAEDAAARDAMARLDRINAGLSGDGTRAVGTPGDDRTNRGEPMVRERDARRATEEPRPTRRDAGSTAGPGSSIQFTTPDVRSSDPPPRGAASRDSRDLARASDPPSLDTFRDRRRRGTDGDERLDPIERGDQARSEFETGRVDDRGNPANDADREASWRDNPFLSTVETDVDPVADPASGAEAEADDRPRVSSIDISGDPVRPHLVALRRALLSRIIDEGPDALDRVIGLAMTLASDPDPDAGLDEIAYRAVPEEDRDVIEGLEVFGRELSGAVDPQTGSIDRERLLEAIDDLRDQVAQTPTLKLPTATLCTSVDGFGIYEPFRDRRFTAGQAHPVIVYVEVEDFVSEEDERGRWVTDLKQRLLIYPERDPQPVWTGAWSDVTDVVAQKRRDFFVGQILELPEALPIGRYRLKVQIHDKASGAEAETTIDFEIFVGGPGSVSG